MEYETIKGMYLKKNGYIVGKGPSLKHLRRTHFPFKTSPVLTINEAILPVERLNLPNTIYSLQKTEKAHPIKPESTILILQKPEYSEDAFLDCPNRILVDPIVDMQLSPSEMSVRICIKILLHMGCNRITFVCCDSLTSPDLRRYDVKTGLSEHIDPWASAYDYVIKLVWQDVKDIPHKFVVPTKITFCTTGE